MILLRRSAFSNAAGQSTARSIALSIKIFGADVMWSVRQSSTFG